MSTLSLFTNNTKKQHKLFACVLIWLALMLSACGDSTAPQVNTGPPGTTPNYTGPAPANADIQAFKLNFWDNLSPLNRCGACHSTTVGQPPTFVDDTDINAAYLQAVPLIDLDNYANSLVVTKVAGDHNCWLTDDNACAAIIEAYIVAWKGGLPTTGRQIVLTAPPIKDPGDSKNFPANAQDNNPDSFELTVYPILTTNCIDCHSETSATPTSPFFANGVDVDSAYEAAKSKMDLDTPPLSRFVAKVRGELHNCWTADCESDAQDLEDAIIQFSGAIIPTKVDPNLITSKALNLGDATIASGGNRYENNTIALWEFKTGIGSVTFDTSGVDPALDLTLSGSVGWVLGDGIEIINGKAQGSTGNSQKLYDLITASGEYAIEAWVVPANVTQDDSRIISYAASGSARNFTMGQSLYNYEFLQRTELSDPNGMPSLETDDADQDLQASLQHVVMNFDPVNGRQIFVNGVFTDDVSVGEGTNLTSWSPSYAFVLGSDPDSSGLWMGKIRLAAIHNRALTQAQITQNFSVGVGKKYFMLFSVAARIGIPDTYILFHVEQFDNNAYLFNQPRFISLDPAWTPSSSIIIKGMRIGVNGREAFGGQSFANMDEVVDSASYDAINGQFLSTQGTIIALEKGPGSDEFFLTFEQLDSATNSFTEPGFTAPLPPSDPAKVSDIGMKTFDEINATMSAITGVPITNPIIGGTVADNGADGTYTTYRQQLPSVENISAFLASQQMAVAQMAMSYCNVLVNTNPGYFAPFDFTQTAGTAFNTTGKTDMVIDPLLENIMNVDLIDATNNLDTQPDETEIRDLLGSTLTQDLDPVLTGDAYESLITTMTQCATVLPVTCDTVARTQEIVKATCAAILGSASMVMQ